MRKRILIFMLVLALAFSLSGCRMRLVDEPPLPEQEPTAQETLPEQPPEPNDTQNEDPPPPEPDTPPEETIDDAENTVPITPNEAPQPNSGDVIQTDDTSENVVTIPVPSEQTEGETTLDSEGEGTLGTIIDDNETVLARGLGALYDCQKGYVYFETDELLTINRHSSEHSLITDAGGYNVGEKLKSDALNIESDWVVRKNPSLIVKCVSPEMMNNPANTTDQLRQREGWGGTSAVINNDILLISNELLASDEGRLLAKLYIAKAMYPSLFEGGEIETICRQIAEAGGRDFTNGVYVYGV